MEKRLNPD